jgi:hypothetical protein
MIPASPQSNDLAPGLRHWWASTSHASHSVPPAAGTGSFTDGDPVATTAPGPIVAVLMLPAGEQTGAIRWSDLGAPRASAER